MSSDYERMAGAYGRHRTAYEPLIRELATGARLTAKTRVLEIGAGTADYISALRRLVGCSCTAVEPSTRMREIAEGRGLDVDIRAGGAEALPLDAASFDFAFSVQVVHHVKDRRALFAEAFRVLDDGGMFCVATESHDMIRARYPLAEYFPDSISADLARYPAIPELEGMARESGFRDWRETSLDVRVPVTSADAYEAKAFSSLHFVPEASFEAGLRRLKADLARGPMMGRGCFALLWATK
jgi:ubiquinone/menaquinone biosynthesis C-methylase UbiE